MSLGKKIFSSAFLLLLRKIWGNLVNVLVMAYLARVLSKEDFGMLAISSVLIGLITTLGTSGIAEYIIYYDEDDKQKVVSAAFWLNLLLTVAIIVVVIAVGPYWSSFYNDPKIYSLLFLLVISFFFEMTSTIPKSLLRKELNYSVLVFYGGVSQTTIALGKVVCAYSGLGVYSLALPQAIVSPFLMIAFYLKTHWRPELNLGVNYFKPIMNYSKHLIGGRLLTKLVNEGDNLIVGKLVGLEGLGIYTLAFQLANLVTTNVVFLINDLVLPVLSKVKRDVARLREVYLKMIQLLSLISFPLIIAFALAAEPIVMIVYGGKWIEAIVPFQILSVFALGRSLSSPSSSLFSAVGKPKLGFLFTLIVAPIFLLSVWVGSFYGVIGVAVSTTLVRSLASVAALLVASYLINLSGIQLFERFKKPFVLAIALAVIFYCALSLLPDGNFDSITYTISTLFVIPIFIYVFFVCLRIWDSEAVNPLTESFRNRAWAKPFLLVFKKVLFL
jgi:O-antigen/teichoic acid export membrane protein